MSLGRYEQIGVYVPPPSGRLDEAALGHFEIRRIPAPPEARTEVFSDLHTRSTRTRLEMRLACPQCLHDIRFCWEESTSHEAMERWRGQSPIAAAVAEGALRHAEEAGREASYMNQRANRLAGQLQDAQAFIAQHIAGRHRPSKERIRRAWKRRAAP